LIIYYNLTCISEYYRMIMDHLWETMDGPGLVKT